LVAPLQVYEANVTSQCGEDGVIRHALEVIGKRSGWCVEVGAADGKLASNTLRLIEQDGYRAVLIESDHARFASLQARYRDNPRVITIRATVGLSGADGLDAILQGTPAPPDLDLLCIDIDAATTTCGTRFAPTARSWW